MSHYYWHRGSDALTRAESNSFQHFWEDGIFQSASKAEEISVQRRKVLLAVADTRRQIGNTANDQQVLRAAKKYGIMEDKGSEILQEFIRRKVLTAEQGEYRCKVPFFESWLLRTGVREIIMTFEALDEVLSTKKSDEDPGMDSRELAALVRNWGPYKGHYLTEVAVRSWLSQMGSSVNQQLMLMLLKGLRFYSSSAVHEKLKAAHNEVSKGLIWRIVDEREQII